MVDVQQIHSLQILDVLCHGILLRQRIFGNYNGKTSGRFHHNALLATISTVLGCGVIPAGQGSNRTFTVTGFTLPVAMAYSSAADVQARIPGIAPSEMSAQAFVQRLVMQTILDVLERQARSALLPDAVITTIFGQLSVHISYKPLNCPLIVSPGEARGFLD
ncbi:hypothetical protein KIN20_003420 [Parelaphostrongylus tenuis]|uniref:Uncharacterized protein n=1 Tax=Parelaphostrongylus tenuis TaxID=148309 RepID=A0AAD5QHF2_PARTN|nr:hypothetical protein KIN20_003420 [Parelaphostrongylus tenuis]